MPRLFNVIALTGVLVMSQPSSAFSETAPTSNQAYVVDMSLGEVISWFEKTSGMIIRVGNVPQSTHVRATMVNFGVPEFMTWLQQRYDIAYYRHGQTIYLSASDDSNYRIVYLNHLDVEQVKSILTNYELHSSTPVSGRRVGDSEDGEIAILTGPSSYLEIAEGLIARAESGRNTQPIRVSIMRAGIRGDDTAVNHDTPTVIAENE